MNRKGHFISDSLMFLRLCLWWFPFITIKYWEYDPDYKMKYYKTILIDPPWKVQNASKIMYKCDKPIEKKYLTMTQKELLALNINELAAADCSLFLWTTHTFLIDALSLIKQWGFKYHCVITWNKGGGFSMHGFHRNTELCLFAYRGKINLNQKGKYIPLLITEKKTIHSKKPIALYELLESNSPMPRLELFARTKRAGWDVWGNEVDSDIQLQSKEQ